MLLSRKSGLAIALLAFWGGWGHAPPAEARPSVLRLARATSTERSTVKKRRIPPELAAAIRLYERLEYEAALTQLAVAKSSARHTDDRVLALLYEGIVLANLGFPERSREAFRAALRTQPSAVLPVVVSPKIAQIFQQMREEVPREPPSQVTAPPPPSEPAAPTNSMPEPPPALAANLTTSPPPETPPASSPGNPSSPPPLTEPVPALVQPGRSPPPSEQAPPEQAVGQHAAPAALTSHLPQPLDPSPSAGQPAGAPWAPENPPRPEDVHSVKGSQTAIAVGGVLAAAGIVLYAAVGSANPEHQSSLRWTGGIAGIGGLGLVAFGTFTGLKPTTDASPKALPERDIQPVISLHSQSASVGARMSF